MQIRLKNIYFVGQKVILRIFHTTFRQKRFDGPVRNEGVLQRTKQMVV